MKKRSLLFLCLLLAEHSVWGQSSAVIKEYILQYKDIAMEEMRRTGIPASIKLAQGIHETAAGQSSLVQKSNNHFGIKCKTGWQGESVAHDDDAPKECFRKYESPFDSYRDHSDFLKTRQHYAALFELDPTDYEGWAYGLKKAGYATNPKYPQILIKLIRDYNLQDYTLIVLGRKEESPDALWAQAETEAPVLQTAAVSQEPEVIQAVKPAYPSGVFRINDTKVVFVAKGTSYLSVAEEHNVQLGRLFEFNDMQPQEVAESDQLVFLQRKRKTGGNDVHKVAPGESLHGIAQAEGIRLESLMAYNYLQPHMQPQAGEVLYLKENAPAMPRLAAPASGFTLASSLSENNAVEEEPAETAQFEQHVVQPKETLYAIARKYSVRVEDIRKWNDLLDTDLKAGQSLRIKKG